MESNTGVLASQSGDVATTLSLEAPREQKFRIVNGYTKIPKGT